MISIQDKGCLCAAHLGSPEQNVQQQMHIILMHWEWDISQACGAALGREGAPPHIVALLQVSRLTLCLRLQTWCHLACREITAYQAELIGLAASSK